MLTANEQQSIRTLAERGCSRRRIAWELGLLRETAGRCRSPASASAGEVVSDAAKPAIPPAGSVAGRRSACEPFQAFIEAGLTQGLSAQRLYHDLRSEYGFAVGYDAVKRLVRAFGASRPLPFRRMEMAPGEEVQVDYGQGAWVIEPSDTRYRPQLLRLVLSASRKRPGRR